MVALPTVPTFTDNTAPSVATLQQLSDAVRFVSVMDVRPTCHLYKTSTQSIVANTQTTLTMGSVAYDSDNMSVTANIMTIHTQGIYAFEMCAGFQSLATAMKILVSFLFTAGTSNPHKTSGSTQRFGQRGGDSASTAATDTALCLSDICPIVCYPGDTIAAQVLTDTNVTMSKNDNNASFSGRVVPTFTGYFVSEGT